MGCNTTVFSLYLDILFLMTKEAFIRSRIHRVIKAFFVDSSNRKSLFKKLYKGWKAMKKSRFLWADIAKAIAIIAVLLGHTDGIPPILSRFVFTFHMPLFFIISGYFMKDLEDSRKIKIQCKKDATAILFPYALTCALMIILAMIKAPLFHQNVFYEALQWLWAGLYGSGGLIAPWAGNIRWIGAIWFLLALFIAKFIVNYTQKYEKYQPVAIAAIAYVGYATTNLTWLPLSIQAGMTASLYVYIGKMIGKYDLFNKTFKKKDFTLYLFAFVVWGFCVKYCGRLYMVSNFYANGFLDIIGSICATFAIVWISMIIEKYIPYIRNILAKIGGITLPILCCHILELNLFPWYIVYRFLDIEPHWALSFVMRCVLVSIMTAICYFVPIINRVFFPRLRKKHLPKNPAL